MDDYGEGAYSQLQQSPGAGQSIGLESGMTPTTLSVSVTAMSSPIASPQSTNKNRLSQNLCTTVKCEMQLVLASTEPPKPQIIIETLPTFCFPYFDPDKPIDLCVPLPVTRLTFDHPSLQDLTNEPGLPYSFTPQTLRSREMVHSSYCRNQLRLRRKHALFKLGVPSWSGQRKLLAAVRNADLCTVTRLLQDGIDPNSSDDKKRTPLHIAASQGLDHIVSVLVAMRADPNRHDILGNTPLHLAACRGDTRTVKILLGSGADIHLKDSVGRTPLCIVKSRLSTLRKDKNISTDKLIRECQMISCILKAHSGQATDSGLTSIDALCNLMQNVTTREQADEITDAMVDKMSQLEIANRGQIGMNEKLAFNFLSIL